jgi:hypothetical protein
MGLGLALAISPAGRGYLEVAHDASDAPVSHAATRIRKAYERGSAHGLVQLGAVELGAALPPSLAFGREFAPSVHGAADRSCHAGRGLGKRRVARPPRRTGASRSRSATDDGRGLH